MPEGPSPISYPALRDILNRHGLVVFSLYWLTRIALKVSLSQKLRELPQEYPRFSFALDAASHTATSWWQDIVFLLVLLLTSLVIWMTWNPSPTAKLIGFVLAIYLLSDTILYHLRVLWFDDLQPDMPDARRGVSSHRRILFVAILSFAQSIFLFPLLHRYALGSSENYCALLLGRSFPTATLFSLPTSVNVVDVIQVAVSLFFLIIVIAVMASIAYQRREFSAPAGTQQNSVTSSPPDHVFPTTAISGGEPTSHNDPLVIALQAQIKEMRRSENRLLTTVLASIGAVFALAIGLAVYSGWSSTKVYERDKQALRDDLKKTVEEMSTSAKQQLIESMDLRAKQLRDELLSEHGKLIDRFQVEGFAHTLGYVADIRLSLHDVEGALRAGLEQFDAATRSNTNYMAHALDKLTKALGIAIKEKQQVPPALLDEVQGLLQKYPQTTSDPRIIELRRVLESYHTIK